MEGETFLKVRCDFCNVDRAGEFRLNVHLLRHGFSDMCVECFETHLIQCKDCLIFAYYRGDFTIASYNSGTPRCNDADTLNGKQHDFVKSGEPCKQCGKFTDNFDLGYCSVSCFKKCHPQLSELKRFSGFLLSWSQQKTIGVKDRFPIVCGDGLNRAGCGDCDICIRNRRCPCLYCDVKGTVA